MSLPAWLGYLFIALFVAGVPALLLLRHYRDAKAQEALWRPVGWEEAQYCLEPGVQIWSPIIAAAWVAAFKALLQHGPFTEQQLRHALGQGKVYIRLSPGWDVAQPNGEVVHVNGVTDWRGGVMTVGPTLAALCHEMGHAAFLLTSGDPDPLHRRFRESGIDMAQAAYFAELRKILAKST